MTRLIMALDTRPMLSNPKKIRHLSITLGSKQCCICNPMPPPPPAGVRRKTNESRAEAGARKTDYDKTPGTPPERSKTETPKQKQRKVRGNQRGSENGKDIGDRRRRRHLPCLALGTPPRQEQPPASRGLLRPGHTALLLPQKVHYMPGLQRDLVVEPLLHLHPRLVLAALQHPL